MHIAPEIIENSKIYEEVVNNLAELFIKLGIQNDPVKIYETFRYIYMNGFLSNNSTYSDIIPNIYLNLEFKGYIPIDICGSILLSGYGVCRHTSDFLFHLYQNLRYDSSQLFTYHPSVNINVHNYGKKFLTNYDAQKLIDEVMKDFDLFSREELHFVRKYGDVVIHVDYIPEDNPSLINHTMNIVLDKKNDLVHILDTKNCFIGERIDTDIIRLEHLGFTHIDFVQRDVACDTYYGTNYFRGLGLLEYDTNIKMDVLSSILCSESCKENIEYYEEFQLKNQKKYNKIDDNIHKLNKKLW